MDGWTDRQTDGWMMDERMGKWVMVGWRDGWMVGCPLFL